MVASALVVINPTTHLGSIQNSASAIKYTLLPIRTNPCDPKYLKEMDLYVMKFPVYATTTHMLYPFHNCDRILEINGSREVRRDSEELKGRQRQTDQEWDVVYTFCTYSLIVCDAKMFPQILQAQTLSKAHNQHGNFIWWLSIWHHCYSFAMLN